MTVWLSRAGQLLFCLFCSAGMAAGGFLLLCAGGFLNPAALLPAQEQPSIAVSAPASLEEEAPVDGPWIYLSPEASEQAAFLSAGCNGVLVPMKTADGTLEYVSGLEDAANWQASSGDPQRNRALRALNSLPALHTVAVVSCLRDGLAGQESQLSLLRPSGSPWLDDSGIPWLDPARPEVLTYLIGVCRELALLGFDEILLTNCAYPDEADLQQKEAQERTEILEAFCRQLQGALADLPVSLSILGQADALQPQSLSGQTVPLLASFPGRVWAERENAHALSAFSPVLLPER